MANVLVKLDTSGKTPVVKPDKDPLDMDRRGMETIHWTRSDTTFHFVALVFKDKNPFSNTIVTGEEITTLDNNQGEGPLKYTILVEADGTYYSSDHGKDGKGKNGKGKNRRIAAGGPIIKNN